MQNVYETILQDYDFERRAFVTVPIVLRGLVIVQRGDPVVVADTEKPVMEFAPRYLYNKRWQAFRKNRK